MSNDTIPSRANWFASFGKSIFKQKPLIINDYLSMLFARTNTIFEYEGLPETIPKEDLELIKQTFGSVTIAKADDGKLYAFYGALGGKYNEYYHPTISIVTNPYLNLSKEYVIDKDCVVIKNDLFYNGLSVLNRKYAELLTECDITIRKCLLNVRVDNVVTSQDDSNDESINQFFDAVEKGDFAYISTKKFMDDVLLQIHEIGKNSSNPFKDLIEVRNYIDSCWWIDMGLNANANMKREAINESEINADDKTMIPLINQMLKEATEGVNRVNKMFNTNISVKLSSVWEKMREEVIETPKEEIEDKPNIESEEDKEGENDVTNKDE